MDEITPPQAPTPPAMPIPNSPSIIPAPTPVAKGVQEVPKRNPWKIIAITLVIVIMILIALAILFTVMFLKKGQDTEKPIIEKPNFPSISQALVNIPSTPQTNSNQTGNETLNQTTENITNESILEEIVIESDYITYLLNEIGAYMLHPPPFSSNLPVLEFRIDDVYFTSIVEEGITYTEEKRIDGEDLRFFTDKLEILEIMNSDNMTERFIESLRSGDTSYEMVASEQTLLLKGYVALYETISGESVSLTGSVVRTFIF